MTRKVGFMAILWLAVIFLMGTAIAQAETIRIGGILPLTGPLASYGKAMKKGAEFAAKMINEKYNFDTIGARWEGIPNLGGAKVELFFADHQGKPDVGVAEAERLIQDKKIVGMIGTYMSGVAMTVSTVCERRKIPMVSSSTATSLTQRDYQYFFRVTANAGQGLAPLIDAIDAYYKNNNLQMKGVGLIMEDTASGVDNGKKFVELSKAKGWPVLVNIKYSHAGMDFTSECQKVKAADPALLFQMPYTSDGILLMKTWKKLGWLPKIMLYGGGCNDDPKFQQALGSAYTDYITERVVWSLDLSKAKSVTNDVNEAYKKFSGTDLDPNNSRYITQLQVLVNAINNAKSSDPAKIQQALVATNISEKGLILFHGVKFDEKHDNPWAIAAVGQRKNGYTHIVLPEKFATMKYVFPMPGWGKR